ncbi:hypothetical protein Desti_5528 [Desulfomonile tiedjei DSM 6799]|uniref:Uncharacterized protein n=1 Tax=Desulfomonile tiedjei (strain ATCC 49306 / DSM 6799 / DCB-1) TaxID=706587 RepID=I4CEW9_DESTA|nr:hypothetical protein Desti_5528 [Desulfomonile tiedjei DSM 6799]
MQSHGNGQREVRKHRCRDCKMCQNCAESRCIACKSRNSRPQLSFEEQIALFNSLNAHLFHRSGGEVDEDEPVTKPRYLGSD